MAKKKRAVVVTTEHRGVFFGYVEADKKLPAEIDLSAVRNCVYWDTATRGVLGLAASGPTKGCRIGKEVPTATLWKITGVFDCSPESVKAWESEPWN